MQYSTLCACFDNKQDHLCLCLCLYDSMKQKGWHANSVCRDWKVRSAAHCSTMAQFHNKSYSPCSKSPTDTIKMLYCTIYNGRVLLFLYRYSMQHYAALKVPVKILSSNGKLHKQHTIVSEHGWSNLNQAAGLWSVIDIYNEQLMIRLRSLFKISLVNLKAHLKHSVSLCILSKQNLT